MGELLRTDPPARQLVSKIKSSAPQSLANVIGNKLIREHANTKSGELSVAQKSLVSTTVSLMQDQVIQLVQDNNAFLREEAQLNRHMFVALAERTSDFRAQLVGLYMTPFVASTGSTNASKKIQKGLIRYLSWGNVLALVTAVLFAVSVYYTKAYSNYKDRVAVQSGEITSYKEQLGEIKIDRKKAIKAQELSLIHI